MEKVIIRNQGLVEYQPIHQAMQHFTDTRYADTPDELWILQHQPIYTLGQAGKPEHLLNVGNIPVYQSDRGGQVTYHGPGQLIVYVLMDIKRVNLGVKKLVHTLEQAIINYLSILKISSNRRDNAPGVYVNNKKIAALGLRIRKGCSYHGLSLNVDMDLQPFQGINPCGYADLEVTQLSELGIKMEFEQVAEQFLQCLMSEFENEQFKNNRSYSSPS
ncbi:lipoyl(octanoyl) transferase LipB [Candidatus Halobeggiatoa sp. HSG11]|nr:lipoyl(octanoyl) transferase LipB [Candidatus Halobeggiatoa sp. HSG11]